MVDDRVATSLQAGQATSLLAMSLADLVETVQALGLSPHAIRVVGVAHVTETPGPPPCTCQLPWSSHGNYTHADNCPAGREPCIECGHDGRTYDGHVCEEERGEDKPIRPADRGYGEDRRADAEGGEEFAARFPYADARSPDPIDLRHTYRESDFNNPQALCTRCGARATGEEASRCPGEPPETSGPAVMRVREACRCVYPEVCFCPPEAKEPPETCHGGGCGACRACLDGRGMESYGDRFNDGPA